MSGFNLSQWALGHRSFVLYLMVLSAIAGAWAYTGAGRDEDPPFTVKTMVVKTLWPGATTAQTTDQVTDRIEKKLQELPDLDFLQSYSGPGESTIFITLKDDTPPAQVGDRWYQVRKKVGDIRATLPAEISGPFFDDEFGDTFGVIYGFSGDGFDARALKDYSETVRAELLRLPDIGKTTLIGTQDETVTVEISSRRLAALGITRAQLAESLASQNVLTPAGTIDGARERMLLRVSGGFTGADDIAAITLPVNGRWMRLEDIATIRRAFADPPQPSFRVNGRPAIGLAIAMAKGGDNLRLGALIHQRMAELEADRPVGIQATLVADQPAVVAHAVHGFVKSLTEAVAIVLAVSFISLGLRAGAVVALSIPLVLGMTFVGMKICGIDLHRVSLGALIIALGLLVDDAMITVEMMVKKLEEGWDRARAATFAFRSTAFPMLTGTLVTVIGFVPVGFAESASGEYCFAIFAVIAIALLTSWVVAVLFSPLIGVALLPAHPRAVPGAAGVERRFRAILLVALRHRTAVIIATLALFIAACVGATRLEQQFFPVSERPELLIDLNLPQATSIRATQAAVERMERLLAADPAIARFSTHVGQGAVRFYLPMDVQLDHDFYAQAVVVTKDGEDRDALAARLIARLGADQPEAMIRVSPLELGPPVGWPLKYRVSGPDSETTRQLALALGSVIAADGGTNTVHFDWNEPVKTIRVRLDQDKARLLGLSTQAIAGQLAALYSGTTVTQVRDATTLVDVDIRAPADERQDPTRMLSLQIALTDGRAVPLAELAQLEFGVEQPIVWRRDRRPTVTVLADISPGAQAATVVERLAPAVRAFAATLPAGYRVETGGTVEESAKGQASINKVMPVMAILMVTVLMAQLQSVQRLVLVASVAPLGLIGVVAVMLSASIPMGFVATLGVIALVGMIIRNSVILVCQIDHERAAGLGRQRAVVVATLHRMRPILLTAAAAILGMIPIASDGFWQPLAVAVMGGLVVATLLTLLFLPAAYLAWFGWRDRARGRRDSLPLPGGGASG